MTKSKKSIDERIAELTHRAESARDREIVKSCAKITRRRLFIGEFLETSSYNQQILQNIITSKAFRDFLPSDRDRELCGLEPYTDDEKAEKKRVSAEKKNQKENAKKLKTEDGAEKKELLTKSSNVLPEPSSTGDAVTNTGGTSNTGAKDNLNWATTKKGDKRLYLNASFDEKDSVKKLGALFDSEKKAWYITPEQDTDKFVDWIPKTSEISHSDAGDQK